MLTRCLLILLLSVTALAQQSTYIAREVIAVAATAIGMTAATINAGSGHQQATQALCTNETAEIRISVDGTSPTSSVGTPIEALQSFQVIGNNALNLFRAIRTTSTSGSLTCVYSAP